MLTYEQVKKSEAIKIYITRADESLAALGFTEHSFSHVIHVAETAGYVLSTMGFEFYSFYIKIGDLSRAKF